MKSPDVKPLAVAYTTAYFPFVGGAEIALLEVAKRLPQYEWHVVTARMDRSLLSRELMEGITVHRVGPGFGSLDKFLLPFLSLFTALKITSRSSSVLIWSMMASQASVGAAFLKFFRPRFHLVLTLQEGDEESHLARYVGGNEFLYKLLIRPWYRMVFRSADAVTAISEYLKNRALLSGVEVLVDVIPNGVDLDRFKASPRREPDGVVRLITASRLVEKNGVGDLIEALALLPHNVELTILGGGHLENSLRARVNELHLGSRVHFLGAFNQEQEYEYLKDADIFVRPALSEGLGIAYLNAMAVGLPVVGTPVGGIPDFLKDSVTGYFCEPRNPASIVDVLTRMLTNPEEVQRVARDGQKLVRERYGWEGIVGAMSKSFGRGAKPRVLMAAGIFPPDAGGPARHAFEYRAQFHQGGYVVRTIPFGLVRHLPPGVRHLLYTWRLIFSGRYSDVLFAHDALSVGVPSALVAKLLSRPLLVRSGGDVVWERQAERGATRLSLREFYDSGHERKSFLFYCARFVLRSAHSIIVPSPLLRDLYHEKYGVESGNIEMIPNPIPKEDTTANSADIHVGFFASRLVAYKNLDTVLAALSSLPSSSSVRLEIAGDGPERVRLEERVLELGIENRISFRGIVSEQEVEELSRRSGFALAPALTEFNPNYVLRAVGQGKPFLVSRENGLHVNVPSEFLFDPRNAEELARKLVWISSPEGYAAAKLLVPRVPDQTWSSVGGRVIQLATQLCAF